MPKLSRDSAAKFNSLFLTEDEIAHRLGQTLEEWAAKSIILEREGLPKIDPLMTRRFWPAVCAFFRHRYGLTTIEASRPDGEENLNAL